MKWIKNILRKEIGEKKDNPFTIKVPSCIGNRYVISDIHGCLKTFKHLVEKLNLTNLDQLFFLGDYIDKGANSKGVLDFIVDLKQQFQIYPIKGNHEDDLLLMIEFQNNNLVEQYLKREQQQNLFKPDYHIEDKYVNFIKELPYFIELEDVILVHAGFDFKSENPYENIDEMVWIRDYDYDEKLAKGKRIIHGHTPYPLKAIKMAIKNKENILPLDNGCVFSKEVGFGNLLCLNIATNELIIQQNIENI